MTILQATVHLVDFTRARLDDEQSNHVTIEALETLEAWLRYQCRHPRDLGPEAEWTKAVEPHFTDIVRLFGSPRWCEPHKRPDWCYQCA